ncbi:MAG: hypothetical protein K5650_04445 [Bacteroidales bacterium]|nr:hypothetical protein [Bacteroidales bacterium]
MKTIMNLQDFENRLDAYADGTLSLEETKQMDEWFAAHPELTDDPALRVTAPKAVMPGKENLKRTAVVVPLWRYAAAACIAALLICGALWLWQPRQAVVEPEQSLIAESALPPASSQEAETQTPAPRYATTAVNTQAPRPSLVEPLPRLEAAPIVAMPAMPVIAPRPASTAQHSIVESENLIVYIPDTVDVDFLVGYTSPIEGQPEWLESITTPVYNRMEEDYNRFENTMVAMAEKNLSPFVQIFKK